MSQKENNEKKPQQQTVQVQQVHVKRKIGQGALGAAFRQGFSELTNALKAFPDSLPLIEQPGQMNNVPPAGVSQQAGFTSPPISIQPKANAIDQPTHTQHQQTELVTSHGKTDAEKTGVISQMREEVKANPPRPELDQDLSK